jgi:hypothetical protein
VVGLKGMNSPLVTDEFKKEGLEVALIPLDEPGNFDPEKVMARAKKLFLFVEKGSLKTARLVTEKGLSHCLEVMTGRECIEVELSGVISQLKCLYQVVVAVEKSEISNLQKEFSEMQILGITRKSAKSDKGLEISLSSEREFQKYWGLTGV